MELLLLAAFGAALVDWSAVYTQRERIESAAKPLVLIILIVAIVQGNPTLTGWMVVVALGFSLIGDVFLLPGIDRFIAGLAAFLVCHVVYIGAFVGSWGLGATQSQVQLIVGIVLALVLWVLVGQRIVTASKTNGAVMGVAVLVYAIVLSAMLISGFGVGSVAPAVGVLVFAMSDGVLGWNRFVAKLPHGRLLTHVPYHLGQGLLAHWAINLT